jgi:hypothetical protein
MTNQPNQPNHLEEANSSSSTLDNAKELGKFAGGGAAAGASVFYLVGGMGLAFAGTAVGIGIGSLIVAGAVTGSAAYGVKKALFDSSTPADPNQPSTMETVTNTVSGVATQAANTVSEWAFWISQKTKGSDKQGDDNAQKKT